MAKEEITSLESLFDNVKVDKIGVARLEDWRDTSLWDNARRLLPEAKSAIVLAMEEFPEVIKYLTSKAQIGELTLRDLYSRNKEVVNGHLDWEAYKIVKKLHQLGFQGLPLPASGTPFDGRFVESTFSYGHAAQAAGLGALGWHSMLMTPEYGSRVRLACIITDAPLPPTSSTAEELPCIKCGGACIKVCPVSAIAQPEEGEIYQINKYACNTYLIAAGGCAECLRVCPVGNTPGRKAK